MYRVTNKKKFGVINKVEQLENIEYEVIGNLNLINLLSKHRPDLLRYNSKTNIATTRKAEKLQQYINSFHWYKDYKFIFVY